MGGVTAPTREQVLQDVLARRRSDRPMWRRAAQVLGGLVLLVASLPLLVVLPEAGVPLGLLALRVLALEFDWAARAYAVAAWGWARFRAWFEHRHPVVRALVIVGLLALAVGLIVLIL